MRTTAIEAGVGQLRVRRSEDLAAQRQAGRTRRPRVVAHSAQKLHDRFAKRRDVEDDRLGTDATGPFEGIVDGTGDGWLESEREQAERIRRQRVRVVADDENYRGLVAGPGVDTMFDSQAATLPRPTTVILSAWRQFGNVGEHGAHGSPESGGRSLHARTPR